MSNEILPGKSLLSIPGTGRLLLYTVHKQNGLAFFIAYTGMIRTECAGYRVSHELLLWW